MAININGIIIKDKDYLQYPREQITTTVRKDLLKDYRSLMKALNKPTTIGWDVFIEMISEDEEMLQLFAKKVRNY